MASSSSPNRFVRAVSSANRKAFLADCTTVELEFSAELCEASDAVEYVYFPMTAYISQLVPPVGDAKLEVGLIGDEGMLGATLVLGVGLAPHQAIVQGAGTSLRMERAKFLEHVAVDAKLDALLKRYLFVQLVQFQHATLCTRFHHVEERLARWLLMVHDRTDGDSFHMTHEYLAAMLGVRRVGVTQAATSLQKQGLISYRRGEIVILERELLEEAACACYVADNEIYAELMS